MWQIILVPLIQTLLFCSMDFPDSSVGKNLGEGISYPLQYSWASLVPRLVKNLPAMQETLV